MSVFDAAHTGRIGSITLGFICVFGILAISGVSLAGDKEAHGTGPSVLSPANLPEGKYTLTEIIRFGLKNNPRVRIAGRDVESEAYGIDSAKAERMPRLDLGGGVTRYRWDMPLTPIVITLPLSSGTDIPDFRRTIWDTGLTFRLPLFRGGRLMRGVKIAEMRKAAAEDMLKTTKQDLTYNLTAVYFKISQLEKLLRANEASVRQLEAHKANVELFLKTGTAPKLDLLKTDVELSHAVESKLLVRNNLSSAYELLKTLMGMDDMSATVAIIHEKRTAEKTPPLDQSLSMGLSQRPDFKAAARKLKISEERVKNARAKRLPDIYAAGQYGGQAGNEFAFKENYYLGVKFTVPVFDGGLIRSEIDRERVELEKAREEERALRLTITREVRDAHLAIGNAMERIEVTEKAMESARENLRVEMLKYDTGAGTTTDVIDARTAMLRAETEYYQASFDKDTANAYLKKVTGDEGYEEEVGK